MSILWLSWIDFETAGIGLVATPRPSVHGDITQIDALQVIKQCHKWDKRGRRDDDRGVSPCFYTIPKRVHRTFKTIWLKWERIGYDLYALFLTWSLLEFGILACESETWRQKSPHPHSLHIKGTFDSICTTARGKGSWGWYLAVGWGRFKSSYRVGKWEGLCWSSPKKLKF